MSSSVELQDAILAILRADSGVGALIGDAIYDGPAQTYPCVQFGPASYVPDDADEIDAGVEVVQLDCWVKGDQRLWVTKRLVGAVRKALHRAEADLATSALVSMEVTLTRSFMDVDGLTGHGVVQVECIIEER